MENNIIDSGSRVTRSLRRRLESVDSDNHSRPGTPTTSKLTLISDISSPPKLIRVTRRNSACGIATPTKTPAKRPVISQSIVENLDMITPTRTRARRRSISTQEQEESAILTKVQKFPALDEEVSQSTLKSTIVTRSQSKSPQEQNSSNVTSPKKIATESKEIEAEDIKRNTLKKRKAGPKSKTRAHAESEDASDVEISVFENDTDDSESSTSHIPISILLSTDDEQSQMSFKNQEEESEKNKIKHESDCSSHTPSFLEKGTLNVEIQIEKTSLNAEHKTSSAPLNKIAEELDKEAESAASESKDLTNLEKQKEHTAVNNIENKVINAQKSSEVNLSVSETPNFEVLTHSNSNDCTTHVSEEKIFPSENFENVSGNSTTPLTKATPDAKETSDAKPLHSENIDVLSTSTLNRSVCKVVLKKVDFVTSPTDDSTMKNTYPKTPVSKKLAKSFKENRSPCEDISYRPLEKNYLNNSPNVMPKTAENTTEVSNEITESDVIVDTQFPSQIERISVETEPLERRELFPVEEVVINKSLRDIDDSVHEEIKENEETEISAIAPENINDSISTVNQDIPKENSATIDDSNADIQQNNTSNNNSCIEDNDLKHIENDNFKNILTSSENGESKQSDEVNSRKENTLENLNIHENVNVNDNSEVSTKLMSGNDNDNISPNKSNEDVLQWTNPSVRGTNAGGTKLDEVVSQWNSGANNYCHTDNNTKSEKHRKDSNTPSSEYEEEEEQSDGKEESDNLKHDFLDNEAMEVNDYESGDSLDSEERREMNENEILVDGESIGSRTTDDQDENNEEESDDSFLVSDSEYLDYAESSNEENELAKEMSTENSSVNSAKIYRRLQRMFESSSSSSDEGLKRDEVSLDEYCTNNGNVNNDCKEISKCDRTGTHKEDLNENSNQSESTCSKENIVLNSSNLSRSVGEDGHKNNIEEINIPNEENHLDRFNESIPKAVDTPTLEKLETELKKTSEENETITSSPDENTDRILNAENIEHDSDCGENSVTSKSQVDGEINHKSLILTQVEKVESGLSISLHNYREEIAREGRQRSFTIDVTVKDGELETDVKLNKSVSSPSTSADDQENENENMKHLETSRQMPFHFRNPLIRTKRQSLVLPANPDAQICADVGGMERKVNRKSLGVLSSNDFKPSQSFIDTIELHKNECNAHVPKRKRLSKSFCGASETHDNSTVDVDVCQLHKRTKLMAGNMAKESQESIENNNCSRNSSKISSTPYEKKHKNDSYIHQRIMTRCDEILEAANRAKLEAKTRNRKNKSKISKKQMRRNSVAIPSEDANIENNLRKTSKEIKRKVKTKTALSQAIMAADVILNKRRKLYANKKEQEEPNAKQLPAEIEEAIGNPATAKKQFEKETIHKQDKTRDVPITSTAAGSIVELPKSPERKMKKSTYIQLPTGKVSVEPITPKKRLVKAFNGAEFRESPASPCPVGFKVRKIGPLDSNASSSSSVLKIGKRQRCDTSFKGCTSKAQWTQSGFFKEEQISRRHGSGSQKRKNYLEDNRNFKEKSVMRHGIQRSTKRDILLLKQRRQI